MGANITPLHPTESKAQDKETPPPTKAALTPEAKAEAFAGLVEALSLSIGKGKGQDDGGGKTPSWLNVTFGLVCLLLLVVDFVRPYLTPEDNHDEQILSSIEDLGERVDRSFADLEREVVALRVAQDQQAEAFLSYVEANKDNSILPDTVLSYIAYRDTQDRTRKILSVKEKEKKHENSNPNQ